MMSQVGVLFAGNPDLPEPAVFLAGTSLSRLRPMV